MSGTPTEAEVQTQWRNTVAILESLRNLIDGTVAGGGGLLDDLYQSLEGEYTPAGLTAWGQRMRNQMAALIGTERASAALQPCLFEYARLITDGGYTTPREIMRALYEHFVANSLTVESRAITYDTSATLGAANIGNGAMSRLTLDENNFPIENCFVETKRFRCRQDRNTGGEINAEVFESLGDPQSADSIALASFGSGVASRVQVINRNAGTGRGGSLLKNSSFDSYNSTATPKFTGWAQTSGGAQLSNDIVNFYTTNPNASVDGSLKITGGGGLVTITQSIDDMRQTQLNSGQPYFLRVMVNKTIGTASGGTFTIRMGSIEVNTTIAALGANWVEVIVPLDQSCWPRQFHDGEFLIQIEWSSSTSGYLLVDDAIFCAMDQIDGTFWVLRQNAATPAAWEIDDTLEFTDTGGAPTTAKLQWWLWVAGLGYLPSTTGAPTFTEP